MSVEQGAVNPSNYASNIDYANDLIKHLPEDRAPYIMSRLALCSTDAEATAGGVTVEQATYALFGADLEGSLRPPLSKELRMSLGAIIDKAEAAGRDGVGRLGRFPTRPARVLLAWAIDEGSRSSNVNG